MTKKSNDSKFIAEEYRLLLLKRRLENFLLILFFDSSLLNMMSIDRVNINAKELTEFKKFFEREEWF